MSATIDTGERYWFGVYTCRRCKVEFTVNDGTWRLCTPDLCHDCIEHISKQYCVESDTTQ